MKPEKANTSGVQHEQDKAVFLAGWLLPSAFWFVAACWSREASSLATLDARGICKGLDGRSGGSL